LENDMRKSVLAGVAAGALLAAGAGAPALAVEPGQSELSVLHGVPDTTVDVYVNGELTLDDFAPGTLTDPLTLAPGDYTVALTAPDAADDSAPLIPAVTVTLAADMSYTAVAHLDAGGAPMISLFTNDISATGSGEGRLTVRHVAAAPAVDVLADGTAAFTNLENPDEVMADLPAATYSAAVALAGTTEPVLGPADVEVAEGVNTIVYAWGSAEGASLALAVQTVDTDMGAPSGVAAGSGPIPADGNGPVLLIVVAGLALAGAGLAARAAVASRH
jgi:hypothetical protein